MSTRDYSALFVGGSVTGPVFKGSVKMNGVAVDPTDPEVQKKLFPGTSVHSDAPHSKAPHASEPPSVSFFGPKSRGGTLINHGEIILSGNAVFDKGENNTVSSGDVYCGEPSSGDSACGEPLRGDVYCGEPSSGDHSADDDIRANDNVSVRVTHNDTRVHDIVSDPDTTIIYRNIHVSSGSSTKPVTVCGKKIVCYGSITIGP